MFKSLFSIAGQIGVITGGCRGLGFSMARGFLEAGTRGFVSRHARQLPVLKPPRNYLNTVNARPYLAIAVHWRAFKNWQPHWPNARKVLTCR